MIKIAQEGIGVKYYAYRNLRIGQILLNCLLDEFLSIATGNKKSPK